MSNAEAQALINDGKHYCGSVWANPNPGQDRVNRAAILAGLNNTFQGSGVSFGAGPFQGYEHLVRVTGAPMNYPAIFKSISEQDDGGVALARSFRDWYTDNDTGLLNLPPVLQALAVITHFSESARGYWSDVTSALYPWIDEIANAQAAQVARNLWGNYLVRFPPTLTYAQDAAQDYVPSD